MRESKSIPPLLTKDGSMLSLPATLSRHMPPVWKAGSGVMGWNWTSSVSLMLYFGVAGWKPDVLLICCASESIERRCMGLKPLLDGVMDRGVKPKPTGYHQHFSTYLQ